ncbi:hypothetical protein SSPO_007020 [Streptomyces antimycoticus]|uniref:acetyl-CoA C-acetyltransferase n=1 Tax=Streptomyces antimycoticus TaxID=68175 RepID=A0A499UB23_9ACTN|nr:hypothetical protein [Streptomyces antimycoticus]BBJ37984.1 hypothetical protein SSPO_007020 [Streptomyces antimycoticus]
MDLRRARCATLGGALGVPDLALFEIHEESAGVAAEAARTLGGPLGRVKVNGGAPAFGHVVGMSGAPMVLTPAYELRRRGGGTGAVAVPADDRQREGLLINA